MLKQILIEIALPFAIDVVKKYIESTSTTQDDKILSIIQNGASYLADKNNNTVLDRTAKDLQRATIRKFRF